MADLRPHTFSQTDAGRIANAVRAFERFQGEEAERLARPGQWLDRSMRKIRLNADTGWIQVAYVVNPTELQWENAIPTEPCPSGSGFADAGGAELFRAAGAQESGDTETVIFGDSVVTLNTIKTNTVQISSAAPAVDGTGSTLLHVAGSGPPAGGSLFRIDVKATGPTAKGIIRIFHDPGSAGTKYLIGEIPVDETNPTGITPKFSASWTPPDPRNGFPLAADDRIYVSTYEANTFNVTVTALDAA